MKKISVCYILSYYSPNYIRTRTLIKALQQIGDIKLFQARNTSKGLERYLQTLWKLIVIRYFYNPDFYMLGFRGYEIFWPIRLITLGKPLIFDHMMSPYDSLVNERRTIKPGGLISKLIYLYEKTILICSDVILTDTDIHKVFFEAFFGLPSKKLVDIPVGTDEDIFFVTKASLGILGEDSFFKVLFYGSFLPLHGMDVILKSASLLQDYPIRFTFIGGDKEILPAFFRMIEQLNLNNVTHIDWVEFELLPQLIAQSDIGLGGPFGDTGQAHRVITGKTFQFLAMGKPVIIGDIDTKYGFEDKFNCIKVPQGDDKALAEAISWAFKHRSEIQQIGLKGNDLFRSSYSINQISEKIRKVFN